MTACVFPGFFQAAFLGTCRLALCLIAVCGDAPAQSNALDALRATLLPMRQNQKWDAPTRGATPALTGVKHQLIAWIESRFAGLRWKEDRWEPGITALQDELNYELDRAGLFCTARADVPCAQGIGLGALEPVALEMKPGGILVVRTSVGLQMCGVDQSAYAYEQVGSQWRRFWQSERNDYAEDKHLPQQLDEVAISAEWDPGKGWKPRLILTIGHLPWCSSTWHPIYYRVWQIRPDDLQPPPLLDGRRWASSTVLPAASPALERSCSSTR